MLIYIQILIGNLSCKARMLGRIQRQLCRDTEVCCVTRLWEASLTEPDDFLGDSWVAVPIISISSDSLQGVPSSGSSINLRSPGPDQERAFPSRSESPQRRTEANYLEYASTPPTSSVDQVDNLTHPVMSRNPSEVSSRMITQFSIKGQTTEQESTSVKPKNHETNY